MIELTSKQRKGLERLAQRLKPLVIVGQSGATQALEQKVAQCLNDHELVKVRFNEFKEEKKELALDIANATNSTLVRLIGNVATFYKESDDEEKRKIKLNKLT